MPMKSIVCGITGSENSRKAFRVAAEMALKDSAQLTYVYVVDTGFLKGLTVELRPEYAESFLERLGSQILDEAVEAASSMGVQAKKVLRKGRIMDEVSKVIKEVGGDLLIVGDEGRTFAQKVLFGKRIQNNIKEMERISGVHVKVIQ